MLCHTSLFIFSLCSHVIFYKTLMSLSTVFIKGHVGFLQLLKWLCCASFFTHVEPFQCIVIKDIIYMWNIALPMVLSQCLRLEKCLIISFQEFPVVIILSFQNKVEAISWGLRVMMVNVTASTGKGGPLVQILPRVLRLCQVSWHRIWLLLK